MRNLSIAALPILVLIAQLMATQYADPDLWGRLSVGAVWFEAGHLPRFDDFSYTTGGRAWIDHEWLAGVVFYLLVLLGGEAALTCFKFLAGAATLALVIGVHRRARLSPDPPLTAAIGLVALSPVYLLGFLTTVRAQTFSLVGFAATLFLLEGVRTGRLRAQWLGALPALAIVWGNAHGGFVMGVMVSALYSGAALLARRRQSALHYGAAAFGMLAAVALVNPYGPVFARVLLEAWTLDRSQITEWLPLLQAPPGAIWALAVAAVAGAFLLGTTRALQALRALLREPASEAAGLLAPALVLLLLVAMTLLSLRIQSFLALALVALLPALAPTLVRRVDGYGSRRFGAVVALACLVPVLYLAARLAVHPALDAWLPQRFVVGARDSRVAYPVGAVRWLRASPYSGRLLNPFTQGEFLLWTLYPRFRVAMDGRYEEVYTQQEFRDVRAFYRFDARLRPGPDPALREAARKEARETLRFARKSGADLVLLHSRGKVLPLFEASPVWLALYDDGEFSIYGARRLVQTSAPLGAPPADLPRATIADYLRPEDRARFRGYPAQAAGAQAGT